MKESHGAGTITTVHSSVGIAANMTSNLYATVAISATMKTRSTRNMLNGMVIRDVDTKIMVTRDAGMKTTVTKDRAMKTMGMTTMDRAEKDTDKVLK